MSNRVQRSLAQLAGGFSLLALVLASIGIYGMMAYAVNIRTGEIGLRIAPGARASQVLSRVLREAFWVTGAGIVLGLIAALWLMRFIRVMLYSIARPVPGCICTVRRIEMRLKKLEFPRIRPDSTDLQWLF